MCLNTFARRLWQTLGILGSVLHGFVILMTLETPAASSRGGISNNRISVVRTNGFPPFFTPKYVGVIDILFVCFCLRRRYAQARNFAFAQADTAMPPIVHILESFDVTFHCS